MQLAREASNSHFPNKWRTELHCGRLDVGLGCMSTNAFVSPGLAGAAGGTPEDKPVPVTVAGDVGALGAIVVVDDP